MSDDEHAVLICAAMRDLRADAYAEGFAEGHADGLVDGAADFEEAIIILRYAGWIDDCGCVCSLKTVFHDMLGMKVK